MSHWTTWLNYLIQSFNGLALILLCQNAMAEQETPLSVVTELFDRFQFIDENNVLSGYSVEVMESLFKLTGETPEIEIYPWSVAYQKARGTPNVMIFSIARNIERETNFHWIGRLYHEPIYFWSLKSLKLAPTDNIELLKPYTIAVVKHANSHRYLVNRNFPSIYLMTSTFSNIDTQSRLNMLNGERAHMVIASEHDVVSSVLNLGLKRDELTKVFHDPVLNNDLYIALSLGTSEELIEKYRDAYQQLQNSGVIKQLYQKWNM